MANLLDFILGGGQPQLGGAIGAALNPSMSQAPVKGLPTPRNRVLESPQFGNALTRLGLNLMASGEQGGSFLGSLGQAGNATLNALDAQRAQEAEIALKQAQMTQGGGNPFGDSFDAAGANAQYQFYKSQGMDDNEAMRKAYNDVISAKPVFNPRTQQYERVGGMPAIGQPMQPTSVQAPIGQQIMQDLPNLEGAPVGVGLLPPPQAGGTPDMSLFPQPRDAMQQDELFKAQVQAGQAGAQELAKQEAQKPVRIRELQESIRLANETIGLAEQAFSPTGLPVAAKQAIARITGAGGQVQDQLVATAQIQSLTPQMLAPMLKKLTGDGPVANAERAAAEKVFADANSTAGERVAVLRRLVAARQADLDALIGRGVPNGGDVVRYNPTTGEFE